MLVAAPNFRRRFFGFSHADFSDPLLNSTLKIGSRRRGGYTNLVKAMVLWGGGRVSSDQVVAYEATGLRRSRSKATEILEAPKDRGSDSGKWQDELGHSFAIGARDSHFERFEADRVQLKGRSANSLRNQTRDVVRVRVA